MTKICQAIWNFAAQKYEGKSINLSRVSKETNVRVATLWTYHHGKARWQADLWIRGLLLLGHARVENGSLVIPLPDDFTVDVKPFQLAYKIKRTGTDQSKLETPIPKL